MTQSEKNLMTDLARLVGDVATLMAENSILRERVNAWEREAKFSEADCRCGNHSMVAMIGRVNRRLR